MIASCRVFCNLTVLALTEPLKTNVSNPVTALLTALLSCKDMNTSAPKR